MLLVIKNEKNEIENTEENQETIMCNLWRDMTGKIFKLNRCRYKVINRFGTFDMIVYHGNGYKSIYTGIEREEMYKLLYEREKENGYASVYTNASGSRSRACSQAHWLHARWDRGRASSFNYDGDEAIEGPYVGNPHVSRNAQVT